MSGATMLVVLSGLFQGLRGLDAGLLSRGTSLGSEEYPECRRDLEQIADGLARGRLWALKIADASTKVPPGILTGHLADYGNFDECLDNGGSLPTQHCVATIRLDSAWVDELAGNDSGLASALALRWSYCIPVSCPGAFLQKVLREILETTDSNLTVTVADSDCQTGTREPLTVGNYVGMSIWGIFVGLAVLSTIYDVAVTHVGGKRNPWLGSFSVYANGRNLLSTGLTPETLAPLHGLRFLSICWVLLGHRYFFTFASSLLNLTDLAKELEKVRSQFFIQGVLAVDTFFLLSGFLNCFLLLKVLEETNRFPATKYYVHRYLRLTPVLAAVVLMYATWYALLGDGPVWKQTTSSWQQLCVDHWWPTLLYINNYYNPLTQCAGQSWYLAVDMQLYWLSPLVVVPLWRWPRAGRLLLWLLLALSVASQFVVAFVYRFRMSFTFGFDTEEYEQMTKVLYVPTHMRATPYLVGVVVGHHLRGARKSGRVLSKVVVRLGWLLSTLAALAIFFGNFQFSRPLKDHPYDRWESSFYISLHRLGWGAAVGWIIVACLQGSGGFVNAILSWKAFVPLSRLTYCIFLSHMAIQQYQIGTARTPDYVQYFNQVHRYFGDLCLSVLAAAGMSLVFESPILVLEKLTGRKPSGRNLKSEVNQGFQEDSGAAAKTHEI